MQLQIRQITQSPIYCVVRKPLSPQVVLTLPNVFSVSVADGGTDVEGSYVSFISWLICCHCYGTFCDTNRTNLDI